MESPGVGLFVSFMTKKKGSPNDTLTLLPPFRDLITDSVSAPRVCAIKKRVISYPNKSGQTKKGGTCKVYEFLHLLLGAVLQKYLFEVPHRRPVQSQLHVPETDGKCVNS